MNSIGYSCGTPDGTFGAGTETALKNFQRAHKLTGDGLAGSATLNAIQKAVNNLKQPVIPSKRLSENVFKLLASYKATSAVKDKKGNVVSIPILDIGDGMYTIGKPCKKPKEKSENLSESVKSGTLNDADLSKKVDGGIDYE